MSGQYARFFWPLTLVVVANLLTRQFQNAVLARYPDATRELAVFAIATSVLFLCMAAVIFIPQMVNVFARSKRGMRVSFVFVLGVVCVLTLPMLFFGFTPWGEALIGQIFSVEGEFLDHVTAYLRILSPVIILHGIQFYLNGLLVQGQKTQWVTATNFSFLFVNAGILWTGLAMGWNPVINVGVAQIAAELVALTVAGYAVRYKFRLPEEREHETLVYGEVWQFFWPVALTSMMFSFSRPVIYSFVGRLDNAEMLLAAMRVGFDLGLIFFNPVNQFRNVMVTFGRDDRAGVRRFMMKTSLVFTAAMLIVGLTPLSNVILSDLLGVKGPVRDIAQGVFLILAINPMILTFRNYFHGQAMVERRTGKMGLGGLLRVGAIYLATLLCFHTGLLNAYSGTLILCLGFFAEALAVMFLTRRGQRKAEIQASAT